MVQQWPLTSGSEQLAPSQIWSNPKSGEITICGAMDYNMYMAVSEKISNFAGLKDLGSITLTIMSGGGYLPPAFALAEYIEDAEIHVHTHAAGQVMSAALIVFLAGHTRSADYTVDFMTHPTSWTGGEYQFNTSSITAQAYQQTVVEDRMIAWITERTDLTENYLREILKSKGDWYFGYEFAEKYGVLLEDR